MDLVNRKEKLLFKVNSLNYETYENIPRMMIGEEYVLSVLGVPHLLRGVYCVSKGSNVSFTNIKHENRSGEVDICGPMYLSRDSYSEEWVILKDGED